MMVAEKQDRTSEFNSTSRVSFREHSNHIETGRILLPIVCQCDAGLF